MIKSIFIGASLIVSSIVIIYGILLNIREKKIDKEYLKDLQDAENSKE